MVSAAWIVFASALLLLVTSADPATALAFDSSGKRNYAVTPDKAHPVDVTPVATHPVKSRTTPAWDAAHAKKSWPLAGSADVVLPAPGSVASSARSSAQSSPSAAAGNASARSSLQAGKLPIRVSALKTPATPATAASPATPVTKVRVSMAGQDAVTRAGIAGVMTSVTRTDGGTGGSVHLALDYTAFRDAYGGDWASRLHLVQLPGCALTTPGLAQCRTQTPLRSANDVASGQVSADVVLPAASTGGSAAPAFRPAAQPVVLAALAGGSGGGGTYGATSLSPSGQWSAGGSTGGFSWSYPIGLPEVPGGLKPSVALNYGSQGVDGRISSTNSQASWVGDGWDYSPGFVERSYVSCSDDAAGGSPKTSDECWSEAADSITLSLNGSSNTLVYDDAKKTWHPQSDSGEKISVRTDTVNGDNDHEYWVVTTQDGTDYYFGKNQLPGWTTGSAATNSVWTVPVFGNDANEPCHAATFDASSCQQAYRWNLDYVVDSHGNALSYWYTPETGYYGKNNATTPPTSYTRSGYLAKIQYGQRAGKVYDAASPAAAQVLFDTAERCTPVPKVFDCAPDKLTAANAARWPDVPFDQNCPSTGSCANHGPSFWTTKRLTGIRTQVLAGTKLLDVDGWSLTHSFPATGDTTTPALWLTSITRTGLAGGGSDPLPPVTFENQVYANRVDGNDGYQPITRPRMTTVRTESGEVITVNYNAAQCHRKGTVVMPASPATNTLRCYPSYWTPPGQTAPQLDWFNKIVVGSVTEQDPTGGGLPKQATYTYGTDAAWHFNDDPGTDPKYRTYNQWRGYGQVDVTTGTAPENITQSRSTFFRGMGKNLGNSANSDTVNDADALAGQTYETLSYNGQGGALLADTVNYPWLGPVTATRTRTKVGLDPLQARPAANTARTRTTTTKADHTARTTETVTDFDDATGLPVSVDDKGDLSTAADDKCSRTWYAKDASGGTLPLPRRVQTVSVGCAATPTFPQNAVSDDLTFFDGSTDNLAVPGFGDTTMVQKADSVAADGTPHYITALKSHYDAYGRQDSETDALGRTTTTVFTAATDTTPPTIKVTRPQVAGQSAAFTTTTTLDPARGLDVKTTDAAGYSTTSTYDALGRLTAVWQPGFSTSNGPNTKYAYNLRSTGPSTVTTQTLNDHGTYRTSVALVDALLRPRETQTETVDGGRVISDTVYDSHGWQVKSAGPYYATGTPSGTLVSAPDNQVPTQTGTFYDGAGRVTVSAAYTKASETWRTTTAYPGADRTDVTPPAGATPTSTYTDARGNTSSLLRYHGATPGGPADTATYTYDVSGRQLTQDDGAGHTWSNTYDLLGRRYAQDDPDTGHSTSTYDNGGQLLSATDARGKSVSYTYDELGRKTASYDTTGGAAPSSGNQLASWAYDSLKKGLPTSSTRYADGAAYTSKVVGYDSHGWPTASALIVPPEEGALAGSYVTQNQYNPTGTLLSYTDANPSTSLLPQETVTYGYDEFGRQKSAGSTTLAASLSWTEFDEPYQYTLGASGNFTQQTFTYDQQTHRVKDSFVVTAAGAKVADQTTYDYQPSGNVTRIRDGLGDGTTDTQCFTYDWAQRLSSAWTATDACAAAPAAGAATTVGSPLAAPAYWQSWTYDATGNRRSQTDHDLTGDATKDSVSTYTEAAAGKGPAHALSNVSTAGPGGPAGNTSTDYTYDSAGNIATRTSRAGTDTFTFNDEGKLADLARTGTAGSTKYLYDAGGSLLIRRDADSTVLFTGDQEITLKNGAAKSDGSRYISLGGQTVAVHTADSAGERVAYSISDRQGTAQLQIDAGTQQATRRQYKPFGESRTTAATWQGTRGYVGGEQDDATGLTNLGAREYDSSVGRFLTPDPVLVPGAPDSWNAYAYAGNSPVTSSDPSGLCPADLCGVGVPYADGSGRINQSGPIDPGNPDAGSCHNGKCSRPDGNPVGSNKASAADAARSQSESAAAERAAATAQAAATAARKSKQGLTSQIINLVGDLIGFNDAKSCFTEGDVMGCINTALNAVPWGKLFKAVKVAFKAFKVWRSLKRAETAIKDAEEAARAAEDIVKATHAQSEAREAVDAVAEACSVHSFTAGTGVLLADGSTKPIAEVQPGDTVKATDPQTGTTASEPVQKQIVTTDDTEFTDVTIAAAPTGPPSNITTTWHHPFWDATHHRWTDAKDLTPGTELRQPDGRTLTVLGVRNYHSTGITYDLTVTDLHTYFVLVGIAPVLVHNCGPGRELIGDERSDHILEGHAHPGAPGKTVFPENWTHDDILDAVADVATSPNSTRVWSKGSAKFAERTLRTRKGEPAIQDVTGVVNGVKILVRYEPLNDIVHTAFPLY
ncbi:RHS repeat-associated core domain-containing protein [Streptomyces sp. RKAG293]|uniref:RHS repeat-associated core domain-containing protein n=1 Tax=Streptomyces sp. RKAG293 TaxID=2893403 RepID=UPI0020340B0F|nr:RHS repeat-associated core domain-containing protein [Streptomyces sp. RKAG293]MCM2419637.1 EndoU domain-containing protein [Streptomyces sp. RKAG293]